MSQSFDYEDVEDSVDVREVVLQFWRRRSWIVASIVIFSVIAAAIAFLSRPTYRASAVLISVANERAGLGGMLGSALGSIGSIASLAGLSIPSGGGEVEEALAVLRSRRFTESFIEDENLLPQLFHGMWDPALSDWQDGVEPPTLARAYKEFDEEIRTILQDPKTGLITLQIDWRDPEAAARWANTLVERLNAEMRERALDSASASIGYLEAELGKTDIVGTREAVGRLIEAQVNQKMMANVTREYSLRTVEPAMPPDTSDPIWPKKVILIVAGPIAGAFFGMFIVLISRWFGAASSGEKSA